MCNNCHDMRKSDRELIAELDSRIKFLELTLASLIAHPFFDGHPAKGWAKETMNGNRS